MGIKLLVQHRYLTILLLAYIVWALWFTVFGRDESVRIGHDFLPFWTYRAIIFENKEYYIKECVLNIFFFFPLGILIYLFKCFNVIQAAILGCLMSVVIELLQLFLHKGFSETDDVIHNTIGCIMGFYMCKILHILKKRLFGV